MKDKVVNTNLITDLDHVEFNKLLKVNPDGEKDPDQETKLNNVLKPVGKILSVHGYNKKNAQSNFKLQMFQISSFSEKVIPFINLIVKEKTKMGIGRNNSLVVPFTIMDKDHGYKGRYSLLVSGDFSSFEIMKEIGGKRYIVEIFKDLKSALDWTSKNMYYYSKD